tara:strand:+ start:238 stop:477 length:240 start_codon:yes stop_codon:yes gene_type:complete
VRCNKFFKIGEIVSILLNGGELTIIISFIVDSISSIGYFCGDLAYNRSTPIPKCLKQHFNSNQFNISKKVLKPLRGEYV